jgi:hypothetical protein
MWWCHVSKRGGWIAGFLTVTGIALGAECWASWDSSPDTVPWTELIVTYVPGEVTLAVVGALIAWVPVHFFVRYRRKGREVRRDSAGGQERAGQEGR